MSNPSREAALRGLAVVGFLALVGAGMWLAIYSARFVPATIGNLGTAVVSLTSFFNPNPASLSVVPTGTTTIPFENASSTGATSQTPVKNPASSGATSPSSPTSTVYPIGGAVTGTSTVLYGLPDLAASITAVGYLASSTADSFVASSTVSASTRPAVKFLIQNIGTNVVPAGWRFSAAIPSQNGYVFSAPPQQALNPGDSIEYTLGFDQASPGENRSISISADSASFVNESNETNNSATATITIVSN